MPRLLTLILLAVSGYPLGWVLMKMASSEETMLANAGKRDWKVMGKWIVYLLLTSLVTGLLMILITLDENVTSDEIAGFGIATMALMSVPILRYRWQQMKKKKND